ncbi:TonB-dependent receptor [Dechloromonas sp. XY25]|uniref:TonB-dependent receptor n=1 Tax=Dechloromonas hankyongensis TaxID=2908002 RepID=A0ABS9K734_9RHOO|nr:TonB-dependent receptor [Dechloromonas hankyongensis]MCG2578985.1 TonB-dependent receptor [Dechloromonas hankyongensis]
MNTKTLLSALFSPRLPVLLGVAMACPAQADEEDVFFSSLPVVASVSRLPQQLSETPASVTVIDQEMIRASGMRTVEDLLRLVPGFQVTSHNQDPAIVAYHGLSYGLSSEEYGPRVQVLVDGRSQYSPLFKSGVNWNLLPVALENIERIEVIRGSNTISYGSNAFMGVVNIITTDPALTKGWTVSANHGNNGIRDEVLRWGGSVGDANVRFTARSFQDDGFQYGFYSNQWVASPDNRQSQLFDLRADIPLSDRDELQLTGTFARDMSQYGRPDRPTSDPIRNLEQSSTAFNVLWRRTLSAKEDIKLRYGYTEDWAYSLALRGVSFNTNRVAPASVAFQLPIDPGGRSKQHELEFEHLLAPLQNLRLMWGSGLKSTAVQSVAQFSSLDRKGRFAYRVFGNMEYRPVDPVIFNLGASYEHDNITGGMFDPRTSVNVHIAPGHTLRLAASRAHRNPSLYETSGYAQTRDSYGTNPTNLTDVIYYAQGVRPERIDTVELGYLAELKPIRATADVRVFSEWIPNYIQILPLALPTNTPDDKESNGLRNNAVNFAIYPNGRADSAANIENVHIHGYEYQLDWRPFDSTRLMYGNALVCVAADFTDVSRIADDFNNVPKIVRQTRDSAPTHSQSAMLIQKLPYDVTASVMYFRASPMRWRRNDDNPIDASERIDWRLAKGFRLGPMGGELAYISQMVNEQQQGRTINRLADRVHWLSLRVNF